MPGSSRAAKCDACKQWKPAPGTFGTPKWSQPDCVELLCPKESERPWDLMIRSERKEDSLESTLAKFGETLTTEENGISRDKTKFDEAARTRLNDLYKEKARDHAAPDVRIFRCKQCQSCLFYTKTGDSKSNDCPGSTGAKVFDISAARTQFEKFVKGKLTSTQDNICRKHTIAINLQNDESCGDVGGTYSWYSSGGLIQRNDGQPVYKQDGDGGVHYIEFHYPHKVWVLKPARCRSVFQGLAQTQTRQGGDSMALTSDTSWEKCPDRKKLPWTTANPASQASVTKGAAFTTGSNPEVSLLVLDQHRTAIVAMKNNQDEDVSYPQQTKKLVEGVVDACAGLAGLLDGPDGLLDKKRLLDILLVCKSECFVVFFSMPAWLADHLFAHAEEKGHVRDGLRDLGYRSLTLVPSALFQDCDPKPIEPGISFSHPKYTEDVRVPEAAVKIAKELSREYHSRPRDSSEDPPADEPLSSVAASGFDGAATPVAEKNKANTNIDVHTSSAEAVGAAVAASSEEGGKRTRDEEDGGAGAAPVTKRSKQEAERLGAGPGSVSKPAAHGEGTKTMGFTGAAKPFAVEAVDKVAMETTRTVDSGHEFDELKKLLGTCRDQMAAEAELSKHADLMRLVLQEDRVRALYAFSEARTNGGILKGRGGATRGAAPPDAKGRKRKVLKTHGARGRARFADTSAAEDTAESDESVSLGKEEEGSSSARPSRTSSSESSRSDASSADTVEHISVSGEDEEGSSVRPPRTSSPESSGSDVSSADTVAGTDLRREIGMEQSYQEELVQRVLEELHDFGASSQWVLQVTVRHHNGEDDAVGERIDSTKIEKETNFRLYTVDARKLIKVTLKNLSMSNDIKLLPVYVTDTGEEEPEEMVHLRCCGEEYELSFPLQKRSGEAEDAWDIKDANGRTVLKLRFRVA